MKWLLLADHGDHAVGFRLLEIGLPSVACKDIPNAFLVHVYPFDGVVLEFCYVAGISALKRRESLLEMSQLFDVLKPKGGQYDGIHVFLGSELQYVGRICRLGNPLQTDRPCTLPDVQEVGSRVIYNLELGLHKERR